MAFAAVIPANAGIHFQISNLKFEILIIRLWRKEYALGIIRILTGEKK